MLPIFRPVAPLLTEHRLYAVGGAVRAHLRGQGGVEADFATPSLPAAILASARRYGLPVDDRGLRWGSLQVAGCDITTFRTERYTPGSRYPTVTLTTDWAADAARRDFTCNAVYLAPDGTLTDPFGGAEAWRNGQVIWLGAPAERLAEDPLRWWRWLRFAAEADPRTVANPQWYDTHQRQTHPIPLQELVALAAPLMGPLGASRLAKERAKFGAQPHVAAVREILQPLLALMGEPVQRLAP